MSLALTGSTRSHPVSADARRVGLACYVGSLLGVAVILLLTGTGPPSLVIAGVVAAGILVAPLIVEVTALLLNMVIRPGQLTLGRRRRQLTNRGHHVVILTDYVRDPTLPPGSGQRLLDRLAPGWITDQTIVLLYPANRRLQQLYIEHGAVSNSRWNRRLRFDHRHNPHQDL